MVARSVVRSMFIFVLGCVEYCHDHEVLVGEAEGDQVPQGEAEGDKVPQGEPEGDTVETNIVLQVKKTKA